MGEIWRERYERAVATIGHLRDLCRSHRDDAYRANLRLQRIENLAREWIGQDGDSILRGAFADAGRYVLAEIQRELPQHKWEEGLIPYLEN